MNTKIKEVDYIIVGLGIAGISFCEQVIKYNKSFIVFNNSKPGATAKSGGVFNPVILRRFTPFWNNSQFYPAAKTFYAQLVSKLGEEVYQETPILRVFKNVEEQNNWAVASDKLTLKNFLNPRFLSNENPEIYAPFGYGKVLGTARIDLDVLLQGYINFLKTRNVFLNEEFQYENLIEKDGRIVYKGFAAKNIIYCEGPTATKNPFFPKKALICNKGEYLIIKAPELKLKQLLKGPYYVIPMGGDLYKVGATYDRNNDTDSPTVEAREDILVKLRTMIQCDFEVVEQTAGIRPTTKDRRPLLGSLPKHAQMAFFNGLGTHGFLMAPMLSEMLYKHLEQGESIPEEMHINRI